MICPRKDQCMHVQVNISQYAMTVNTSRLTCLTISDDIVIDRKEKNSINK